MIEKLQAFLGEDSPGIVFVSVLLICGTMVGTSFATSSDLEKISNKISDVNKQIVNLDKKVSSTAKSNDRLKNDMNDVYENLKRERKNRKADVEDIREKLSNFEVEMQRINSKQNLIQQKIKTLKTIIERRRNEEN